MASCIGIPGAVNGMIGEKLPKGDEIEVEVLDDVEQQRSRPTGASQTG